MSHEILGSKDYLIKVTCLRNFENDVY